jgi:hypothetical protein
MQWADEPKPEIKNKSFYKSYKNISHQASSLWESVKDLKVQKLECARSSSGSSASGGEGGVKVAVMEMKVEKQKEFFR